MKQFYMFFIKNIGLLSLLIFSLTLWADLFSLNAQDINQVEIYVELINNNEELTTEELWAFTLLYHSSDNEQKNYLTSNITSDRLLNALDQNSTRNSILQISQVFNDEILLLIYLLNEPSDDERVTKFKNFYQNNTEERKLFEVNKKIAKHEEINFAEVELSEFPTLLFYFTEYTHSVNVVDSKIYDTIINFKRNEYPSLDLTPLEREILYAAFFYAYYHTDQLVKIEELYAELTNFSIFPNSVPKRNIFWSLDYVMFQLGYIDRSLDIQRRFTIPLTEYLGDFSGLHSIYSSHGGYLYMIGKYQEARSVFQDALEWADRG